MLGNPRPNLALRPALSLTACVLLLACGSDASPLRVGQEPDDGASGQGGFESPGPGPAPVGDGGIVSGREALGVRVQDVDEMTIELITLACAGDCADIEAVAHGGNPPYAFAWEDGSTTATRRVCLDADATLTVTATDTAIDTDELAYEAQSARADVTATVLTCTDAGNPPPPIDAGACEAPSGSLQPEDLAADIFGVPLFFAGGASLPAGRYRITYVDGCMMYDASWAWTVQGLPTFQFQLIGATTADFLAVLPGTEAPIGVGVTGYPIYEDCLAANRALPPLDFDFAGGKLGIWQNDFKTDDNIAGDASPTWRLSQLPCP